MNEDTIAAIATPVGSGGIGIVRISGPTARSIAEKIFVKKTAAAKLSSPDAFIPFATSKIKSRNLYYGHVIDPDNKKVIDEALITLMPSPKSYTCEDVVEIQAHAGTIGLKMILDQVLKCGARIAEPGEFTKRAYINGRIDLTQAEAVMDVINARTQASLKIATRQLSGGLEEAILGIIEMLTHLLAEVEAAIDFSEESEEIVESQPGFECFQKGIIQPMKALLKNYDDGHLLREGLRLVILGRPNVGKSSLMNRLLKKDRAIVTPIPGTTRDTIEENLNINGLPILLADTAGVHLTEDPVETMGINRSEKIAAEADLILFMIDASAGITKEDIAVYEKIEGKPIILVINKIDLEGEGRRTDAAPQWRIKAAVRTSVRNDDGIGVLKEKIYENSIGMNIENDEWLIPNMRQKEMIQKGLLAAETAESNLSAGLPSELIAIDLREAIGFLQRVVGKDPQVDILDEIFSRFCIGK